MKMQGLEHTEKIRKYCDYVDDHIRNVGRAWNILKEKCIHMRFIYDDCCYWMIDQMIAEHDLSKLSAEEFTQYAEWFFGSYGKEWDSMDVRHEDEHKAATVAFDLAWKHHQAQNPHHWQNWATREHYHPYAAECHCVCMVCDWMAMVMKFGDTAQEYYEKNKDKIELPEWAVVFIYEIFECVSKRASDLEPNNGEGK